MKLADQGEEGKESLREIGQEKRRDGLVMITDKIREGKHTETQTETEIEGTERKKHWQGERVGQEKE